MGILQTATHLSVNESCRYSQRIAVVVGAPSKPPLGNPPSLEEVYIKHESRAIRIVDKIVLLKLFCRRYVCSAIFHHSQKPFATQDGGQQAHVMSRIIN